MVFLLFQRCAQRQSKLVNIVYQKLTNCIIYYTSPVFLIELKICSGNVCYSLHQHLTKDQFNTTQDSKSTIKNITSHMQ